MGLDSIKSLDIFRKLPQELNQSTKTGALFSVVAGCLMIILFISELSSYLNVKISSEMYIDNRGIETIDVNLDVTFYKLPCEVFSLDTQDVMGTHHVRIY